MNQKVVINQLHKLLELLARQITQLGATRLKQVSFERQLFKKQHVTLQDYLNECRASLTTIEQKGSVSASQAWQLEHLTAQCQAIQKVINTMIGQQRPANSRQQELAEFERRLLDMVADLEARAASATGFQEQQQLLSTLETTRQRLERCQTAQKNSSWQEISRNSK